MKDPATFLAPTRLDAGEFVLRAYEIGDARALNEAVNASYEHLKPWMAWAAPDTPLEQSEATVRRFIAGYCRNEDFTMGIWQGDRCLGGTGFHLRVGAPGWGNAEIGMWLRGDMAGHGFGTCVLAALLDWGFDAWGWERLVWRCSTENHASRRVAEKNGMKLEGVARQELPIYGIRHDTFIFSLIRADRPA